MEKKTYEKVEFDAIYFEEEDVIQTSGLENFDVN